MAATPTTPSPAFELAAQFIAKYNGNELSSSLTNDTRLRFYALYKQAREGDCTGGAPGFLDVTGRAKHRAWSGLRGMPRHDARAAYVNALDEAYPQWRAWDGFGAEDKSKLAVAAATAGPTNRIRQQAAVLQQEAAAVGEQADGTDAVLSRARDTLDRVASELQQAADTTDAEANQRPSPDPADGYSTPQSRSAAANNAPGTASAARRGPVVGGGGAAAPGSALSTRTDASLADAGIYDDFTDGAASSSFGALSWMASPAVAILAGIRSGLASVSPFVTADATTAAQHDPRHLLAVPTPQATPSHGHAPHNPQQQLPAHMHTPSSSTLSGAAAPAAAARTGIRWSFSPNRAAAAAFAQTSDGSRSHTVLDPIRSASTASSSGDRGSESNGPSSAAATGTAAAARSGLRLSRTQPAPETQTQTARMTRHQLVQRCVELQERLDAQEALLREAQSQLAVRLGQLGLAPNNAPGSSTPGPLPLLLDAITYPLRSTLHAIQTALDFQRSIGIRYPLALWTVGIIVFALWRNPQIRDWLRRR